MKGWVLAWCWGLACLLLQTTNVWGKRFLPHYQHRGLVMDRRGFLTLDSGPPCLILRTASSEDLWRLMEVVARREAISPLALLQRMTQELKAHLTLKETERQIQSLALDELLDSVLRLEQLPKPVSFPGDELPAGPPPGFPLGFPPTFTATSREQPDLNPSVFRRLPVDMTREPPWTLPDTLLATSGKTLKPPPGARVVVKSWTPVVESAEDSQMDDFQQQTNQPIQRAEAEVTVSPLMSVVEALRQADLLLGQQLGLDPDTEVIRLGRSRSKHCYVVSAVGQLRNKQRSHWTVAVHDSDHRVVYESICLPEGQQVIVTPGTRVYLTYTDT